MHPRAGQAGGRRQEIRTFSAFRFGLEALAGWFAELAVTDVVMEATGQYWKPVWYLLEEGSFELKLVNARHVKILPGRKTDVADAAWLCELLEHGLLRGSFVPAPAIRELRDLPERGCAPHPLDLWSDRSFSFERGRIQPSPRLSQRVSMCRHEREHRYLLSRVSLGAKDHTVWA